LITKFAASSLTGAGTLVADLTVTSSATLLLDLYPNAAAAYSLRKLRTAYTGSAIRVRRSIIPSGQPSEQDIGFVADQLDTVALLAFCGVGNGFVTTWYDQSESANHGIQETQASQPPRTQQRSCTYNATEIKRQVQNISQAYAARFEDLESRNLRDRLNCSATAPYSSCRRDVNRDFDMQVEQLNLQKARDIADLRSRIVEICDPIPAPRDNSTAIERGTNIATTLQELNELFESGALTEEEFQAAKRKALDLE
jgi:hypothetical protein